MQAKYAINAIGFRSHDHFEVSFARSDYQYALHVFESSRWNGRCITSELFSLCDL